MRFLFIVPLLVGLVTCGCNATLSERGVKTFALEGVIEFADGQTLYFEWTSADSGQWLLKSRLNKAGHVSEYEDVYDGTTLWSYIAERNTYTRKYLASLPGDKLSRPPLPTSLGPAPARSISELIDHLEEAVSTRRVVITGKESFLGRQVTVLRYSANLGAFITTNTLWVDSASMFILREEVLGTDGTPMLVSYVSVIQINPEVPNRFSFTPPAGARED